MTFSDRWSIPVHRWLSASGMTLKPQCRLKNTTRLGRGYRFRHREFHSDYRWIPFRTRKCHRQLSRKSRCHSTHKCLEYLSHTSLRFLNTPEKRKKISDLNVVRTKCAQSQISKLISHNSKLYKSWTQKPSSRISHPL